jgi:hypothetical protein
MVDCKEIFDRFIYDRKPFIKFIPRKMGGTPVAYPPYRDGCNVSIYTGYNRKITKLEALPCLPGNISCKLLAGNNVTPFSGQIVFILMN